MHFVAAGRSRLVAKTAWYKMIETVRFSDVSAEWLNAIYNRDLDETGLITVPVEPGWWAPYLRWRQHVHLDRPSWYEWDCQRMWRELRAGEICRPRSLGSSRANNCTFGGAFFGFSCQRLGDRALEYIKPPASIVAEDED